MDWIREYNDAIQAGKVAASRRVKAVYARLASEISHPCGRWHFDEARGERPILFMEKFCRHSKGEWAGHPVRLELFQKAFVQALFGFVDGEGIRQYREGFFLCGRKNGKSTLMSGISLYMLTSDGEGGAEVYSTATKRDQAKLLFDEAHNMVRQSPALSRHFRKRKDDLLYVPTMGTFRPLGNRSGTLDGLNAHLVVMDELHAVTDRNMYEVLRQSMGARRQPLMLMITTAGFVRESIFDETYDHAAAVADGTIEDPRFLPVMYELDDRSEWEDPSTWQKANPGLGTIKKLDDLETEVARARQDAGKLPGILCKHFNIRATVRSAWLSYDDINCTARFDMEEMRGAYCIGGVDLSITTDLTAACILMMRPGSDAKYARMMFWLPEDRLEEHVTMDKVPYDKWAAQGLVRLCEGNTISYHDVTAWFMETVREYELYPCWVYYDSWSAKYFVEEMQGEGFDMVRCIQGFKTLSLPMQMLGTDLQKHLVNYDNNPVLKWCLTNTGTRTDQNGNIAPVKSQNARQRIDGTAALLDAYVGLYEHLQEYLGAIQ